MLPGNGIEAHERTDKTLSVAGQSATHRDALGNGFVDPAHQRAAVDGKPFRDEEDVPKSVRRKLRCNALPGRMAVVRTVKAILDDVHRPGVESDGRRNRAVIDCGSPQDGSAARAGHDPRPWKPFLQVREVPSVSEHGALAEGEDELEALMGDGVVDAV